MVPFKLSSIVRLLLGMAMTTILFELWLTTPILEHLSLNQWRGLALCVAGLMGCFWSLLRWNLSTLVISFMVGLLVGGTRAALPIEHGRIGDAFQSNLALLGTDEITLALAALVGAHCVSRLMPRQRDSFSSISPARTSSGNDAP